MGGGWTNPFIPALKQAAANRLGGGVQQFNPATGRNPYRSLQQAAMRRVGGP